MKLWKNPVTGNLHLQVHPLVVTEIRVDPLPEGNQTQGTLYPLGGTISDLKEIRDILYRMQRPGIAPDVRF